MMALHLSDDPRPPTVLRVPTAHVRPIPPLSPARPNRAGPRWRGTARPDWSQAACLFRIAVVLFSRFAHICSGNWLHTADRVLPAPHPQHLAYVGILRGSTSDDFDGCLDPLASNHAALVAGPASGPEGALCQSLG